MSEPTAIESILTEDRVFPPPAEFAANAHIKSFEEYERLYAEAEADPEAFWAKQAEELHWFKNGTRCSNGVCRTLNGLSAGR
jgi:Domain of unknown function (DUF3448).